MTFTLIVLASVIAMEFVAWATHRFVMHGVGWRLHASHHAPRTGRFEANDGYAIGFAAVAIALIWHGRSGHDWSTAMGVGMTIYGALYAIVHDGWVHRRWPMGLRPGGRYFERLYQAHHIHHAVSTRAGAVSFGFLLAPTARRLDNLRRQVRASRAVSSN